MEHLSALLWKHIRALSYHFQCETCAFRAQPNGSAQPQCEHYSRIDFASLPLLLLSHAHLLSRFCPPDPSVIDSTPRDLCRPTDRPVIWERRCRSNGLLSSCAQILFHLETAVCQNVLRSRALGNVRTLFVGGPVKHYTHTSSSSDVYSHE